MDKMDSARDRKASYTIMLHSGSEVKCFAESDENDDDIPIMRKNTIIEKN